MGHAVELITGAGAAAAAVHPLRRRILEQLREPGTAAGVARNLGLPRQRVTYHVRELQRLGLMETVGERRRGNCVERLVRATATSYLIAPEALGGVGAGRISFRARACWRLPHRRSAMSARCARRPTRRRSDCRRFRCRRRFASRRPGRSTISRRSWRRAWRRWLRSITTRMRLTAGTSG